MLLSGFVFFCHLHLPWLHQGDQKLHNHTHAAGWKAAPSLMKTTSSFLYIPQKAAVYWNQTISLQCWLRMHTEGHIRLKSWASVHICAAEPTLHHKPNQTMLLPRLHPQSWATIRGTHANQLKSDKGYNKHNLFGFFIFWIWGRKEKIQHHPPPWPGCACRTMGETPTFSFTDQKQVTLYGAWDKLISKQLFSSNTVNCITSLIC